MNGEIEDELPSESGYDLSDAAAATEEPLQGETTERQQPWRPGEEPSGTGVYQDQSTSTGTDDEPEGPGI